MTASPSPPESQATPWWRPGTVLPIRIRVMASTLLVLALLTILFVTYFPARQELVAEEDLRDRTKEMAEMVATGVAVGLELNQLPTVTAVVNWAKRNKSLAYLLVLDPDDQIIGSINPAKVALAEMRTGGINQIVETADLLKIATPILYQERQLGTVFLGLSLERTRRETRRFRLTVVALGAGALVVGAVLALMLASRITEPIRRLRRAADEVAAGNYAVAIDRSGDDEVARLAQAFDIMVRRIRGSLDQSEAAATSIAEARDQALAAARAKADFLAAMSHEIRTPMNGVLGMLSLLEETELTPRQTGFVTTASRSANALLTIIDDILDFSKIDAGRLELEQAPLDLRSIIEDVAQLLAEQAHAKGLELTCSVHPDVPDWIVGDPVRIRQILLNLGGNAVKFTAAGQVRIVATATHPDPGVADLRFEIIDTGIGMAPAVHGRLFQPFVQADGSTTRRFGGTGLGLSICRRLVTMMGGIIGVISVEGVGSTFWLSVRLPTANPPPPATKPADLSGLRVLVVDDQATNREILEQYLVAQGAAVILAAGSAEARQRLAEPADLPDVAIIDAAMPEQDGFGLGLALRAEPRTARTPLILLTSIGRRSLTEAAETKAFDGFLTKPMRLRELVDIVATVTGRQAEPVRPTVPTPVSRAEPGHHVRVLLAEDNEINQMLAIEILERVGYQVDVVPNGQLALEARFRSNYHLVLMDCQMPIMDGFEAARAIRQREHHRTEAVPIVALTANAIEGDRQACLAAGMDDYLSKPFTTQGLLAMASKWIIRTTPVGPAGPNGGATLASLPAVSGAPPIEIAHLTDLTGSDPITIRRYLDLFTQLTAPAVNALATAVETGDRDQVRRHAHKIKGSCAMVGARPMAAVAAQIEQHAATDDLDGVEALLGDLRRQFETARTFAAQYQEVTR